MLANSPDRYIYESLSKEGTQFRVLVLRPSAGKDASIHCTLETYDHDRAPRYEALSYTWGRPSDNAPDPIHIDQHSVIVSSNLYDALQALRLEDQPRTLWIDALCINQADNAEKATQVALMGTIYSRARRVLVWLGRATSDSQLAMTTLRELRKATDLQTLSPDANKAIGALFSRAWFTRVWTIQEWGLARENEFICGTDVVPWKGIEKILADLLRGARNWGRDGRESKRGESELLESLEQRDIWTRLLMDRGDVLVPGYGNYVPTRSFRALLEQHIALEATQQRDRIFALMSLAQRNGVVFTGRQYADLNHSLSAKVGDGVRSAVRSTATKAGIYKPPPSPTVDYDKPETEVFVEWARWIIEDEKKLNILFTVQTTYKMEGLPSWVPSWKARSSSEMVPKFADAMLVFNAWQRLPVIQDEKKPITLGSIDVSFSADSREMSVVGVRLDELDTTYSFAPVNVEEYEEAVCKFVPEGYLDGKVPMKRRRAFSIPVLDQIQEAEDTRAAMRRRPIRKARLLRTIQQNRVQFQSSKEGGKKGIVPKDVKVGDILVIFKAVQTPFLLRLKDVRAKRFEVIGEAYVDGFMNAWRSKLYKDHRETFVLC